MDNGPFHGPSPAGGKTYDRKHLSQFVTNKHLQCAFRNSRPVLPKLHECLRIKDAAEYLGFCQNTLRNWEAAGKY